MTVEEISGRVSRLLSRFERDLGAPLAADGVLRPLAAGFANELGVLERDLWLATVEQPAGRVAA